ncbi:hypothetical protein AAG570_007012 [Ranatra chinensis]|uniref:Reverse transcriptase domain-containing protein n=1 Tax=Ranatra chinensis TaxID=642074 RepID=A0ABD0YVZ7_9HEMI
MASKHRNMFQKNKTQETTENGRSDEEKAETFASHLAFDQVWYPDLLFTLKRILPSAYYLILQSYLTNRYSVVCHGDKLSGYIRIKASVPQGSVPGPLLHLVCTADIPTQTSTHMATFAGDISVLSNSNELRARNDRPCRIYSVTKIQWIRQGQQALQTNRQAAGWGELSLPPCNRNTNRLQNPDGTWAKSDSEIANLFGTHLSNIFVPHPDNPDPIHTRTVLNDLDSPLPMSVPPPAFSPSEVKYAISKLPTKKVPGFDLITSTILRQNSHSTIQQCQRVVDNIASCLEQKQYCSAAFLDVAQAFDREVIRLHRVRCLHHPGLNSAEGGIGGWESLPSPNDPGTVGRAAIPTSTDASTSRRRDSGYSTTARKARTSEDRYTREIGKAAKLNETERC